MKFLLFSLLFIMGTMSCFSSCSKEDDIACTESTWYEDADGDGLGHPGVSQSACEQPPG